MKPLAINEHLKIVLTGGRALIQSSQSSYGFNPLQIEGEVLRWQRENPDHPRFRDAVSWLGVYHKDIDAFNKRVEWDRYGASLRRKKELTVSLIELVMKAGLSKERAENNVCSLLFGQIRDEVKDLGSSDGESQSFAVSVVRDMFGDLGYSDEQIDNRLIAVLKAAKKCL